jgi:hypothetical protein
VQIRGRFLLCRAPINVEYFDEVLTEAGTIPHINAQFHFLAQRAPIQICGTQIEMPAIRQQELGVHNPRPVKTLEIQNAPTQGATAIQGSAVLIVALLNNGRISL